ncbi:MAG: AAA family ATPase [Tissierellia bacterium]|nr:AAA family ATPase [Tissierellia bacterium]
MKKLYIIGGAMGVGKTSVGQELKYMLENSVFLDGDWCWDSDPFLVNEENKKMVLENICFLLNQFIKCPGYENVIFTWVMDHQSIIESILKCLDLEDIDIKIISLTGNPETIKERLEKDIATGIRKDDVVKRSIARLPLYQKLNTIKINTDGKSIEDIAKEIACL